MSLKPNYLEERICLNILASSVENARAYYEAAGGHVMLGVLSKDCETDGAVINDMKKYQAATSNALSVDLGTGDPNQSQMVVRLLEVLQPQHVNQVFTGVGASWVLLRQDEIVINGLVSPTGKVGYVNVVTGPLGSSAPAAEVPVETIIKLLKDMGGSSIKYFPMKDLAHKEGYQAVAVACTKYDFHLGPIGGIDSENFEEIVRITVDTGVKEIIPHVHSSIIDQETGDIRTENMKTLLAITKKTLNR